MTELRRPAPDEVLLAIAWGVSLVAWRVPGVPFGAGFLCAVALVFVVAVRTARSGAVTGALGARAAAATLVVVAHALSAAVTVSPLSSWLAVARLAMVVAVALALGRHAGPTLWRGLGWAGTVFVGLACTSLFLGLAAPPLRPFVFVESAHQHVGTVPRFAALTGLPATTGLWALLALAASRALPDPRLRTTTTAGAIVVALATLSSATLAVPAVLAMASIRAARARSVATVVALTLALGVLWVHPLALRVGERTFVVSTLHPRYAEEGLGPRMHPTHTSALGPLALEWHATAYARLAERALECMLEHPVLGVGPGRFATRCPVTTMNTYGQWSAGRRAHNQLGAWLGELGVVGTLLVVLGLWLWTRGARWQALDSWQRAALVGVLFGAFSGEVLESIPVLGLLAALLTPRRELDDRSARSSADAPRSGPT